MALASRDAMADAVNDFRKSGQNWNILNISTERKMSVSDYSFWFGPHDPLRSRYPFESDA